MAKTSYQMLEILWFSDREKTFPPLTEISVLSFVVKKSTMRLSRVSICRELKLYVVLVLGSKAFYLTYLFIFYSFFNDILDYLFIY